MDFSVGSTEGLGQAERLRLCRQLRRRQVENYLEFVSREQSQQQNKHPSPRPLPRLPNRRGNAVHFHADVCLQTAVEETDEKEVLKLLHGGCNFNFSTGNGTSLLHKCCAEGNHAMAELLVLRGADVNMRDDDWWTPLHVACYQDNADIVQLLLTNGGDVSLMDVDGNFPIDHAPQNTDTWDIVISFMESKGLSEKTLKKMRRARGCDMEDRVIAMVRSKHDVNTAATDDGVTMLHIASSNGYLKCGKLLLKHGADVTRTTYASEWTALHCAAKYGQTKIVKMLLKNGADVTATDKGGNTPLNLATEDEIQKILLEAKSAGRKYAEGKDDSAVGTDEEDEIMTTKIIRPSHLPLSKADRLMEGQMLLQARTLPPPPSTKPPSRRRQRTVAGMTPASALVGEDESDDEVYDEIFSNTIYSITETDEGQLPERTAQDDLSSLPSLTERLILDTVLERFADKHIYTYMGDVLIAVNPFTHLPLYGKWASKTYRQASSLTSLPPHAYAIAEHALRPMTSSRTSQCCVIGGESGAGKTETSKLLVQHLMCAASTSEHQLNSKLHQINPLLEAFGNAKTTMNENSSRFAKYLELVFSPDGRVLGGHLNQYLLEKSRVVHQGAGESSFHIFSWLLSGATPEERAHCMLEDTKFKYLPTSGGPSTGHAQQKLLEVRDCMKFVGFSQDDVSNMVTTVAAVLHLGNVRFTDRGDGHTATLTQPAVLHKVCKLLRVAYEDLSSALTEDTITARGEDVKKPLTVSQCMANVQALSVSIYSRLFAWIVNGINQMVAPLEEYTGEKLTIGILDIFGFEHLQSNGFEQMCINLANERLQQYYQNQVFERERQECLSEGVQPVSVVFPSSQQVIDLFMEKNTGVYDLLDEESCFPKASDDTLATKLHSHLGKKHDRVYKTPRNGGTSFTVVHYAGAVQYTVEGVLEKNRDTLRKSLSFVMRGSESVLVKELFQSGVTRTGSIAPSARQRVSRKMKASRSPFDFFKKLRKNSKETKKDSPRGRVAKSKKMPSTLTFHFKNSLQEMLGKLESSTPHFIRCIKPNPSSRPLQADAEYVGAQLRYTGVLQTAILRQQGFAVRPTFPHFLESYSALVHFDGDTRERSDHKACVTLVMKSFQFPLSQVGQSKVFLRLKQVQSLEEHNARLTAQVITAQAAVRRFLAKNFVEKRRISREEYRRQLEFQKELEKAEAAKKKTADKERRQRKEEEEWRNTDEESSKRETTSEGGACSSDDEVLMRRPKGVAMMGVPAEARQSLEYLDSVLSQFSPESPWQPDSSFDSGVDRSDDVFSHGEDDVYRDAASSNITDLPVSNPHDDYHDDDDTYRDAAYLSAEQLTTTDMHRKHNNNHHHHHQQQHQQPYQHPYPQQYATFHPHDVVLDPSGGRASAVPLSPREMYAAQQMGCNHSNVPNGHQGNGTSLKRVPPPLPERSPDTQLSTRDSSRKSSISSKDSVSSLELCNELNEVFDASPHHYPHHHQQQQQQQQPHHPPPTHRQHSSPTTATTPTNANRYADSRPFSYAAGIDAKVLQQQRQHAVNTNGSSAKTRSVSEAYPPSEGCPASPHQGDASRGFHPYGDPMKNDSSGPNGSVNGVMSTTTASQQYQDNVAGRVASQTPQYDPNYGAYPPEGSFPASRQHQHQQHQQHCQGGYQYPPPPPSQMYGGQRVVGPAPVPGLVSPRHVHTHQHIVTKPQPSPPASRKGSSSSSTSPGRSRSPASSAFQPVPSSSQQASSAPSSAPPPPPPPTFPAPPPPVPLQDRYLAATQETRSPSPPLPPPPSAAAVAAAAAAAAQPPPVPSSPRMQRVGRTAPMAVSPPALPGGNAARGQHQSRSESRRVAAQSPVRSPVGHHGNNAMLAELTQAKLRKADLPSPDSSAAGRSAVTVQQEVQRSQSPLGVRLKPTSGKFSNIYQEKEPETLAGSPEELPAPQPPQPEEVEPPLPPPPPAAPPPPPSAPVWNNTIENQLEDLLSRMEIEIPDDIDLSECPGLVELTAAIPNWKRSMIEQKNKEKIEAFIKQKKKEKENEAKWRNVPEWKRALMMKKDQEDQEAAELAKSSPQKASKPKAAPPADKPEPMPKPKGDYVPAALSIDPAELESMPPWKRELLFKREKVPITFSNEFNPDEEEDGQQQNDEQS